MNVSYSLGSLLSPLQVLNAAENIKNINTVWIPETWGIDAFVMMAAISQKTKSRIGSSIINIYSRTPSLTAMGAATINSISNGRFILGLGTSSMPIVEDFHGLKFEKQLIRIKEYIQIIRLALSGKTINYDGKVFHLKNFKLQTKPTNVPIYIAAINQKMINLAWEIAQGVIFYLRPLHELQQTISKQNKNIDIACQIITAVSEDSDLAIHRAKKTLSFYIAVGTIYRKFLAQNGYSKETDAIHQEYAKTGLKNIHDLIPDSMLNQLAICGNSNTCQKQLCRFISTGITHPILQFNPVGDVSESFDLFTRTFPGEQD